MSSFIKSVASQNLEEIKRVLLNDKFSILERDATKQTALHVAVHTGNLEILRFLLTLKKIDVNSQDDNGWTALHCAANAGRYDMCLELLNQKVTKVNIANSDGNTILIFLSKIRKTVTKEFSLKHYYECLQILLQKTVDVNHQNNFGESPLHYASMEGNLEAVYFLCKNTANVNILNNSNETPLMYAVRKNQFTIVRKLLENRADTTIVNSSGFTVFDFRMSDDLRIILEEANSVDLTIKRVLKELEQEKKKNLPSSPNVLEVSADKKKKQPRYCKVNTTDIKVYEKLNLEFYLCRVSGWHCCMKKIECRETDVPLIHSEFNSFMEEINHPNILQYLHHDKRENHIRIFSSIPSVTLKEFLSQRRFLLKQHNQPMLLPYKELVQFALEIAEGLEFLHSNDILHRHLKTSNTYIILKDKGVHRVVINNFYLCRNEQWAVSEKNVEFYEPFYYIPIDARKLHNPKLPFSRDLEVSAPPTHYSNFSLSTQSDVWSYGIMLYEMLTLSTPYSDIKSEETLIEVMKNSGPSIDPVVFGNNAAEKEKYQNIIDIINVCTNPNPLQRPPIDLIANSIRMNINIKDLYGLKKRDIPSTFPAHEYRQHQGYPLLKSVSSSPIIKTVPGFNIEASIPASEPNPVFIQYADRSIPHFQRELLDVPHEHFIGKSQNEDIIVVSMETEGKFDATNNRYSYFTLVRTILEDTHIFITCDNPKDRLRNLKCHPILANFKMIERVKDPSISSALIELENNLLETTQYKIGVIYRLSGQEKEDQMFANSNPSAEFEQFLQFLGEKVQLKGFKKFRGGLDVSNGTTGVHSVYTCIQENYEVMFHVSTLLPYDSVSAQQLHRKRHIGNDVVVIIFQDEGADKFTPEFFASQFNHIFIVVEPLKAEQLNSNGSGAASGGVVVAAGGSSDDLRASQRAKLVHCDRQIFNSRLGATCKFRVSIAYKESIQVQSFPYLQEPCIIDPEKDHDYFISKVINTERVAMKSKEFEKRLGGVRTMLINDLYNKYCDKKKRTKIV